MDERARYKDIPNILTVLRLLMVPQFIYLFFRADSLLWAGLIFLLAGVTDILDGYFARRLSAVTRLGRVLDPLADKLMQVSAFACLAIARIIPAWVILILAAKELVQLLGGFFVLRLTKDIPSSNKYGKAASAFFYFVTIAVIVFKMPHLLQICLLGGALTLSVAALFVYYVQAKRYVARHSSVNKERTCQ